MSYYTAHTAALGMPWRNDKRTQMDAIRAVQGGQSFIYAVLTRDGLVKIGYTKDLAERLRHIKGGVQQILAFQPGSHSDEMALHRSLKGHAIEGREWYLPTPAVLRVVNEMRAPLGLDPIVFQRRFAS